MLLFLKMTVTQFITLTYFYECNIFGGVCFVMTVSIILFANTLFQQITHNIACNLWKEIFILQVFVDMCHPNLVLCLLVGNNFSCNIPGCIIYIINKQFNYNCTTGNTERSQFLANVTKYYLSIIPVSTHTHIPSLIVFNSHFLQGGGGTV